VCTDESLPWDAERRAWLRLQLPPDGTPGRVRRLVHACGGAAAALEASVEEIAASARLERATAERWRSEFLKADAEREIGAARTAGATIVLHGDPHYPEALRFIEDAPIVLYVRGALRAEDAVAIAIVGARRATSYGRIQARRLARDLAGIGSTVVSGMARGIDSEAHRGALDGGGRTIAVLGCGIDVVYPPENRRLRDAIAESGAVVSEFPTGTAPLAHHFPRRNRLVSGLALGVVVVEAAERSGSLVTVDWALSQGREVFAVPGPVDSPLSTGVHRLLREGAALAAGIDDLAREIAALGALSAPADQAGRPADPGPSRRLRLDARESAVLQCLGSRPLTLDSIVESTGYPPALVAATLTSLELRGLAQRVPGGGYVKGA
jgi:DNA processing protein